MSANVPDRATRELYYKPFLAAVDAGVGSAMCRCARLAERRVLCAGVSRGRRHAGVHAPLGAPRLLLPVPRSYNRINASTAPSGNNGYACEHAPSLAAMKATFDGWVMSDWGATHSTVSAANAGLDQEVSRGY